MKKQTPHDFRKISAILLGGSLRSSASSDLPSSGPIFARKKNRLMQFFLAFLFLGALAFASWEVADAVAPEMTTRIVKRFKGVSPKASPGPQRNVASEPK